MKVEAKLVVAGVEVTPNADRVFFSTDPKHMRPSSDLIDGYATFSVVVKDAHARFKIGDDVVLTIEAPEEPAAPAEDVKSVPGAPDVDAMSRVWADGETLADGEPSDEGTHPDSPPATPEEQPDPALYPDDVRPPETSYPVPAEPDPAIEQPEEPTEPEEASKVEDPNNANTAQAPALVNG